MTRFITACVVVETFIQNRRSLAVEGENLARLFNQLAACDRETRNLEYEKRQLESDNLRLRIRIEQLNNEVRRLRNKGGNHLENKAH